MTEPGTLARRNARRMAESLSKSPAVMSAVLICVGVSEDGVFSDVCGAGEEEVLFVVEE